MKDCKIKISGLSPGLVRTEFLEKAAGDQESFDRAYDGKPMLEPEEVAQMVYGIISSPPNVQVHDMIIRPFGQMA